MRLVRQSPPPGISLSWEDMLGVFSGVPFGCADNPGLRGLRVGPWSLSVGGASSASRYETLQSLRVRGIPCQVSSSGAPGMGPGFPDFVHAVTWNSVYKAMLIKACRDPGSNRGPSDLQSDALPTELSRLIHWPATHSNDKTTLYLIPKKKGYNRLEQCAQILNRNFVASSSVTPYWGNIHWPYIIFIYIFFIYKSKQVNIL